MKAAFLVPFVLLLGLVIGGWAPKEELRSVRMELDALSGKLADQGRSQRFDALTRIVQIPDRAKKPKTHMTASAMTAKVAAAPASQTNTEARSSVSAASPSKAEVKPNDPPKPPPSPEDLRARIDEAKELWMTRVELVRAQWIERLKLSPDEVAQFDSALNTMNENLYASMQNLSDRLASEDTLSPEVGVRAFHEMTSALVQTYDNLNAIIPASQQAEAAKMELTDFIDPAIAEPLVAVQDKLEKIPNEHRHPARPSR